MNFNIREASLNDLNDVVELWRKLSIDQMSKDQYYKGSMTFDNGHNQFILTLNSEDCCVFVAEANSGLVAFIEVWLYNSDFHFFADDYAYIMHFFVEESSRKTKEVISIVYRLFKAAENWAISKGRKYLVADVFNHNQRVAKLLKYVGLSVYRMRLVKNLTNENGEVNEITGKKNC